MNKAEITGYMSSEIVGDKCAFCGKKDIVMVIEIDDNVGGLPIKKLYPSCKECADKNNIKMPK